MNTQPESLRLAHVSDPPIPPDWSDMVAAVRELLQLHAENEALQQVYDARQLEIDHLRGVTKSFQSAPAIAGGRCASLPTPCQSCTFSCSRANVCSTIPLVKQTYASKEEKHRTTTTYEACEPVRRNAITPGSRRAR